MTYSDYKQRMGDLIVAGTDVYVAHQIAITDYYPDHVSPGIWFHMFVQEHQSWR